MTTTTKTIIQFACADWASHIETAARRVGAVVALVWTLYSMAAGRWQELKGWIQGHQLHGLDRMGLPGGATTEESSSVPVMVVQRMAAESAAPANPAPPAGWLHISDPMRRAIRMVRNDGRSQRLAASICGVSRSSLQRAINA